MRGIAAGGLGVLVLVAAGCGTRARGPAAEAAHKTIGLAELTALGY